MVSGKNRRLSHEVAQSLEKEIREHRYKEGERLPTEACLACRFAISRAAIREAIAELRSGGLVRSFQGRGTFVVEGLPRRPLFSLSGEVASPQELQLIYELRREVEAGAASLAAAARTPADIKRMRESVDRLGQSVTAEHLGAKHDLDFHEAIAAASGNRFFDEFLAFFYSHIMETIFLARSNTARNSGWAELVQHEHQSVLDAIEAGEPEEARSAMRTHLTNAMHRLGLRRL